jgi:hypothetical protein
MDVINNKALGSHSDGWKLCTVTRQEMDAKVL